MPVESQPPAPQGVERPTEPGVWFRYEEAWLVFWGEDDGERTLRCDPITFKGRPLGDSYPLKYVLKGGWRKAVPEGEGERLLTPEQRQYMAEVAGGDADTQAADDDLIDHLIATHKLTSSRLTKVAAAGAKLAEQVASLESELSRLRAAPSDLSPYPTNIGASVTPPTEGNQPCHSEKSSATDHAARGESTATRCEGSSGTMPRDSKSSNAAITSGPGRTSLERQTPSGVGADSADAQRGEIRAAPSEGSGERDRLVLCGKAAVEALALDDNSNAPSDVTQAIRSLGRAVAIMAEREMTAVIAKEKLESQLAAAQGEVAEAYGTVRNFLKGRTTRAESPHPLYVEGLETQLAAQERELAELRGRMAAKAAPKIATGGPCPCCGQPEGRHCTCWPKHYDLAVDKLADHLKRHIAPNGNDSVRGTIIAIIRQHLQPQERADEEA